MREVRGVGAPSRAPPWRAPARAALASGSSGLGRPPARRATPRARPRPVDHLRLDLRAGGHEQLGDPEVVGAAAGDRAGGVEGAVRGPAERRAADARARRGGAGPRRASSSSATTSPWPHQAAWCSGVPPIWPGRSIGTPRSSRISAAAARPSAAAWWSASKNSLADALGPLRILAREPLRARAVAGEAEPDQLVDRPDLAPRAQLGEQLAEVRAAHPPGEAVGRALVLLVPGVHVGAVLDEQADDLRRALAVDRPQQRALDLAGRRRARAAAGPSRGPRCRARAPARSSPPRARPRRAAAAGRCDRRSRSRGRRTRRRRGWRPPRAAARSCAARARPRPRRRARSASRTPGAASSSPGRRRRRAAPARRRAVPRCARRRGTRSA